MAKLQSQPQHPQNYEYPTSNPKPHLQDKFAGGSADTAVVVGSTQHDWLLLQAALPGKHWKFNPRFGGEGLGFTVVS